MKRILGMLVAGLLGVTGRSLAQPADRVLQFSYDRAGVAGMQYTMALREDGEGVFVPHLTSPGQEGTAVLLALPDARPMHAGPAVTKRLFAAVPMVEGGRCETHNKGIAQTGTKMLTYQGAGRHAQCTFNYSDDDRVNDATGDFQALAATMVYGQNLANKLRFDRLGLDVELDGLQHAVDEGRALEVGNIRPVLESIVNNERVMDRVRRKSERLLQLAGPPQAGGDVSAR